MDDGSTLRPGDAPADDGQPAPARPVGAVLSADPPRNARQVMLVLGTMVVFFVGLVIVANWAAGHG